MYLLKNPLSYFLLATMLFLVYYFLPEKKLNGKLEIDKILVLKGKHEMQLIGNNEIIKSYPIAIGREPEGAKHFEGDDKTPEGKYFIESKNPNSGYYLNLGISYPAQKDIAFAKKIGRKPGGLIKIHGLKNGLGFLGKFHRWKDWTHGCIALTNHEMDELYHHIKIGTPIEIRP